MQEYPKPVTRKCTQKILEQMINPIYKIIEKDGKNNLGFFCYIKNNDKNIPVVIINKFIEDDEYYNDRIQLKVNNDIKIVKLGKTKYKNKECNITVIEIKDNNLKAITFFEIDDNLYKKDNENDINYYKESIYIMNYDIKNNILVSYGLINDINESEIMYTCNINSNIYGYPIFNLSNNKLIGIHYSKSINFNKGILFTNIINEFIDSLNPNNEIVITVLVDEKDISDNNKIYFLDNFDEKHEHLIELNKLNTELYIDNKIQEYQKYLEPKSSRDYEIKLNYKINLTDCSYMFAGCKNITNLYFKSFNTKYITNMSYMFYECENLAKINLYSFNTSNVIDMSYMFNKCNNLNNIDLSSFNTKKVEYMSYMFYDCNNLKNLNSSFTQNEIDILVNIKKDDIGRNIYFLYEKDEHLKELNNLNSKLYINNNEYEYKKNFRFEKEGKYTIKLKFNINLTDCSHMFESCINIINIKFISFNTKYITNMSSMFEGCENLIDLDLSHFNTKNVTNMSRMFCSCKNIMNLDFSSFDTKNVTDMIHMFHGCGKIINLDLSSFDTKNVTDMSFMFSFCDNLKEINLSSFNTKNVTAMDNMFAYCKTLKNLDLSSFDTKKVTGMNSMFWNCKKLNNIYLTSSFTYDNPTSKIYMINGCDNLNESVLTFFNVNIRNNRINNLENKFYHLKGISPIIPNFSQFRQKNDNKL